MKTRKERWVEALRSGEYEQGRRYLCMGGKYCCLGVLADLDGAFAPSITGFKLAGGSADYYAIGFSAVEARNLACMNDSDRPFDEIADYIEANVEVKEL